MTNSTRTSIPILKTAALTTCAAALLTLTTACNSRTKPTPENFTTALNSFFLEHPDCLLPNTRFPFETSDPAVTKQFNTLVKSQLLDVSVEAALHASRYTPTTTGARYAPRFCYGHRTITSIESFTPPEKINGFPETHVVYHYAMQDVPVWAKSADVQAAFPSMALATSGEATGKATLAGTLAGWQIPD
jgi:hypothetical protein